jgi:hypothetical protein
MLTQEDCLDFWKPTKHKSENKNRKDALTNHQVLSPGACSLLGGTTFLSVARTG